MYKTIAILAAAAAIWTIGCNRPGRIENDYATVTASPDRDTAAARQHTRAATKLMENDKLDDARKELKRAMAADLFYGPAHNNLGSVYLKQKRYYLAAWEFQYAAKLIDLPNEKRTADGRYDIVSAAIERTFFKWQAVQTVMQNDIVPSSVCKRLNWSSKAAIRAQKRPAGSGPPPGRCVTGWRHFASQEICRQAARSSRRQTRIGGSARSWPSCEWRTRY